MEMNACGVNYLNSDSLLPPRKRLLAGLKRQNSDVISPVPFSPGAGSELDNRLNDILKAQLSNPNLSNEEIAEASRVAAIEAAKVAKAARANAEEKAAKAAKAVAAAKSALDLVAILKEETGDKEKGVKKNKMKKHVHVEELYNKKRKGKSSCRMDEELARNLHRVINSSPRILRNSSGSDMKNHKHKKLKSSFSYEKNSIYNDAEGSGPSTATRNGNGVIAEVDTEGPVKDINIVMVDLKTSKSGKGDQLRLTNREGLQPNKTDEENMEISEVETIPSKDKYESLDIFCKKRGRIKQKKLPLSICSIRDQTSPKAELKSRGMRQSEDKTISTVVSNKPLFSVGPSGDGLMPVGRTTMWKCKAFKAPPCVEQNKVMQS